ncbi:hypothetical protein KKD70_03845 [Patescibacteria group bacterium]|nr:hypothetical protein [Patescibacteria group bacterium]
MPNNQSNNYFGDITEFFLKAKREENIVIDENRKAGIRANLMNEITKSKGLQIQDANVENPEIIAQSPIYVQAQQEQVESGYTYEQNIEEQAEPDFQAPQPAMMAPEQFIQPIIVEAVQPEPAVQPVAVAPEQFSEVVGPAYMRTPFKQQEESSANLPTYDDDDEDENEEYTFKDKMFDFWYQWQKRFVTIPLALFAIIAIAYAATNLDFTFEKTPTITPKTNNPIQTETDSAPITKPTVKPIEDTIEDTIREPEEIIAETPTKKIETDKPTINIVENYEEPIEEQPRSLIKVIEPTVTKPQAPIVTQEPLVTQPTSQNGDQITQTSEPAEVTTKTSVEDNISQSIPTTTPEIETANQSLDTPTPTQITQPEITQTIKTAEPIVADSVFLNISEDEFEAEIQKRADQQEALLTNEKNIVDPFTNDYAVQEQEPLIQAPSKPLSKPLESETIFIREDSQAYPIYYYRDSTLSSDPNFDQEILDKISNRQGPISVSVYYLSDTQVLVEVKETTGSKWYLFTKVGDLWTIKKYEKEI